MLCWKRIGFSFQFKIKVGDEWMGLGPRDDLSTLAASEPSPL